MPELSKSYRIVDRETWDTLLTVIQLDERADDCAICGEETMARFGLPMYEGEVVSDDHQGPWAGFIVCEKCYRKHRPNCSLSPDLRAREL